MIVPCDAALVMLSSETRRVMELGKVRLDLTPVEVSLLKVDALEVRFLGTVISGKLPKVKDRQWSPSA